MSRKYKRPHGFMVWAFEKLDFRTWRLSLRQYSKVVPYNPYKKTVYK
jgi:hypothetical protein